MAEMVIHLDNINLLNEIESTSVNVESRKNVISFMLENNLNIDTEQFKRYQEEYMNYFSKFEQLKRQIENDYVYAACQNPIRWNLNYSTGDIAITY